MHLLIDCVCVVVYIYTHFILFNNIPIYLIELKIHETVR